MYNNFEPNFIKQCFKIKNNIITMEQTNSVEAPKLITISSNIFDEMVQILTQLKWGDVNPTMVKIMQDVQKHNPQDK